MGYQMTTVMQKKVGDKWEIVKTRPNDTYEPHLIANLYVKDEVRNQRHWNWLGMNQYACYCQPRGLPEDFVCPGEDVLAFTIDEEDYDPSWVTIDEMLAFDYDQPYIDTSYTKQSGKTIREHLGQPFIDWFQELKDLGVERMVFSFG